MKYDVFIAVAPKNIDLLELVVKYIYKNLPVKRVIAVGKQSLKNSCERIGCCFIDEDDLLESLSYCVISDIVVEKDVFSQKFTGWYFQQFLKMAYALVCQDDYYIVWDSDLIPLRPLTFWDSEGIPFFDVKTEYLPSYFCTIGKLFSGEIHKMGDYSFISEHMIIKTTYMREMIAEIEKNDSIKGNVFFEKIMNAIRIIDIPANGFSEYETYGCYVEKKYPNGYKKRHLRTLREGDLFLGEYREDQYIKWASESYDTICFEGKVEQIPELKDDLESYMKNYSLEEVVDKFSEYIIYT